VAREWCVMWNSVSKNEIEN